MNSTDDVKVLLDYLNSVNMDILTSTCTNLDSYWEEADQTPNILQFNFDTPIQFMDILNEYFENGEIKKIISVLVFKRQFFCINTKDRIKTDNDTELPDFVYAF